MGKRGSISLVVAVALVLATGAGPAFADDEPVDVPPLNPVDVPPLVSEPLAPLPPSETPIGSFDDYPWPQFDVAPTPGPLLPVPVLPQLNWTQAQLDSLIKLTRHGGSVTVETAPDGTLLVQDITGYGADDSPNPWVLMGLDGSTALLAPTASSPDAPVTSTNPLLRLDVPQSTSVSFVAVNASPAWAMVTVSLSTPTGVVNSWRVLAPGEVWSSSLAAPADAEGGVLVAHSVSRGGYEDDMVTLVAAVTPGS
jgi:hypothetical protein